ncbi:MAG: DUF3332 domain-containing protein [Muribaculaceae bacterium]|nr:DUF3332 domain-containing protein [Muribaculaceae bacterium]
MKRKFMKAALACVIGVSMLSMQSCIGSFALTSRLMGWNKTVGNKFLNELVFFAFWVLPVYEVTALADVLVLNSIEFWSGENPMAKGTKVIDGNDGRYLVQCDGKGYDIVSCNDGSKVRLDFDSATQTWSYTAGEQSGVLFTFVDDNHVKLPVNGGNEYRTIEISQAGVYAYQQITGAQNLAIR